MVLQKQFCTILMLQKHVSESVLCKTELVYTQKKQTGRMGSYIVVHARRAGRHLEISHSSEQAWFQFGFWKAKAKNFLFLDFFSETFQKIEP